jgi:hypothetical protein
LTFTKLEIRFTSTSQQQVKAILISVPGKVSYALIIALIIAATQATLTTIEEIPALLVI